MYLGYRRRIICAFTLKECNYIEAEEQNILVHSSRTSSHSGDSYSYSDSDIMTKVLSKVSDIVITHWPGVRGRNVCGSAGGRTKRR